MRIGFDFDNTIVSYDALFHKVACEQNVIDESIPVNKIAVRNSLRDAGKEDIWTMMQGYVYGARMDEALAYPNALEVMQRLKAAGHTLAIMSHKTRYPFLGEQYDLHAAARGWIKRYLGDDSHAIIQPENIFFELTKEEKLARVAEFGCDIFIDDLPEILQASYFPMNTAKYLFDPEANHVEQDMPNIKIINSWMSFESHLI